MIRIDEIMASGLGESEGNSEDCVDAAYSVT